MNLFYSLNFGKYPCLFTCIVISDYVGNIVYKQTMDAIDDVFYIKGYHHPLLGSKGKG